MGKREHIMPPFAPFSLKGDDRMDDSVIIEQAKMVYDEVVSIYHDLHQIPELSLEEYETTRYIRDRLERMGIGSFSVDDTGCVAYIGPDSGRTIALRADIDGLPVTEETGCPYASCHEGKMHACGHDGHMAGLLGAAKILKSMEYDLPVQVKLIFQAAEENTYGARRLIEKGVLDDVDEIFGLHLFSDIPRGVISLEEGPRMAKTDHFQVTFTGKGGHAAKPHLTVDATLMASAFLLDLQTLVSREMNPTEGAVVTVGSFHSGSQYNIISEEAVLEGTCRSYTEQVAEELAEGIRRKAESAALSYRGKAEVVYKSVTHPPVRNDPDLTRRIARTAHTLIGEEKFRSVRPLMLGEDFSWYQTKVPGTFAFVGCARAGEPVYPNHHGRFSIDEPALLDAMLLHLSAVLSAG